MGAEPVPILWAVFATMSALAMLSMFGMFRHRANQLASTLTGTGTGGPADDGPLDFMITRRIASVFGVGGEQGAGAETDARAGTEAGIARRLAGLADDGAARHDPSSVSGPAPVDPVLASAGPGTLLATFDPSATAADEAVIDDGSAESGVDDAFVLGLLSDGTPADADDAEDEPAPTPSATTHDPSIALGPTDDVLPPVDPADMLRRLLVDQVTGLGTHLAWDRWLADEEARERRYRRPTTIVVAEVAGLGDVAALSGQDAAVRIVMEVADIIRANVRTSDHAALVGPARFAVLLPETDEVRAINFVERVQDACESWLSTNAPGLDVCVGFGWASPVASTDLAVASVVADRRLASDLQAAATWPPRS